MINHAAIRWVNPRGLSPGHGQKTPSAKMTLDLLKHFGAAAIALTICLALFVGDNAAEVEDAQIATKQLSHKAGKAAVAGNDKVAKAGGGVIIGMTTRSIPRSSGSWGSAAGVGGGGAPADGGANAPRASARFSAAAGAGMGGRAEHAAAGSSGQHDAKSRTIAGCRGTA